MGRRWLDPGVAPSSDLRVYAQCLKNSSGGVAVLVLNVDKMTAAADVLARRLHLDSEA